MIEVLAAVLAWLASPDDVEQLRRTAPSYLTSTRARDHLGAARAAQVVTSVDASLLLSIAHHESRYSVRERTAEEGGKFSCGSMTPEPKRRCAAADLTLVGGYLAGARHLRVWLDTCGGNRWCALTGYAGGHRLIAMCKRQHLRACATPWVFQQRARMIRPVS